ncbi:MAG: hypothetical protein KC800_17525 [Candidatus Eremiobacteraeota bacterium]|nr:hypothetical protein [Candidatus Eremiobacteraeota bacterium]
MKRKLSLVLTGVLLFLAVGVSEAGTWRSNSGNMFHFYPNGAMEAYIDGAQRNGRWWWVSSPYRFQYNHSGYNVTVDIKGQGAVCYRPGFSATYWTQMATRGAAEEKPVDDRSWFMPQIDP